MLKLIYEREYGDCTIDYNVELDKGYSGVEFVNEVLRDERFKNGTIEVVYDNKVVYEFIYDGNRIINEGLSYKVNSLEELFLIKTIIQKKVIGVSALDGWNGNYDFRALMESEDLYYKLV